MTHPIISNLHRLEKKLKSAGFPAMSECFVKTFTDFYQSGKKQLVLCIGRRGGKTTSVCRVAVLEALFGDHKIPPGDTGVIAIVSVNRAEAQQKLRTIAAILNTLAVPFDQKQDSIYLPDRRVEFRILTASIPGVVGMTSICCICDETSRWANDQGLNPAREIIGSLRPTMATMPAAKMFIISSPLSMLDFHYELFQKGDTDYQMVAHAPTWIANPSITEAETHELEPDERVWQREYAAIPTTAVAAAFDPDDIDSAIRPIPEEGVLGRPICIVDPSQLKGDKFAWTFCRWWLPNQQRYETEKVYVTGSASEGDPKYRVVYKRDEEGNLIRNGEYDKRPPVLYFEGMQATAEGPQWQRTSGSAVLQYIARQCKAMGVTDVVGDQKEILLMRSECERHGLRFHELPLLANNKGKAVATLKRWLREGTIILPDLAEMKQELLAFEEKVTASGHIKYEGRGRSHDDYVSLCLLGVLANEQGMIGQSPYFGKRYRRDYAGLQRFLNG